VLLGMLVCGFYMCLNTSALALPVCLLSGGLAVPANALCWVACFIFSVLISFGAVNLFQQGSFIIGGQRASILSTFEPITSLIVGVLVFQEALTAGALLGAVLIISATALVALSDIRASAKN